MAFAISATEATQASRSPMRSAFPSGVPSCSPLAVAGADLALADSLQNQYCTSLGKNSLDNSCLGTIILSMSSTGTATRKEIYDLESYDPKRSIGGLLGRVRIEIGAALDAELAPLDITAAQFAILKSIAHEEAGSASGLCKDISYDPGAMTRMLDRLERRRLVRRVAHPNDRRASNLELTAEGKAVYPKLRASAMKVLNRLLSGFTQKEAGQLERLLQRMLENA
jgi:MarR family transcriptional regulator, multiple antibiotic resistance protein MarR